MSEEAVTSSLLSRVAAHFERRLFEIRKKGRGTTFEVAYASLPVGPVAAFLRDTASFQSVSVVLRQEALALEEGKRGDVQVPPLPEALARAVPAPEVPSDFDLEITVLGDPKTGKSTLATLLQRILIDAGMKVVVEEPDDDLIITAGRLAGVQTPELIRRLASKSVVISVRQARRRSSKSE